MSEGHAFLAPSGYEGWSLCPGKPALEENEPDQDSPYAAEGTLAHDYASKWLSSRTQPADLPSDMLPGVKCYVEAVQTRVESYRKVGARVTLLIEQKLDISTVTGERGAKGTGDAVIIAEFDEYAVLDVWDFKYGMGVAVEVRDNGQLMIYALAALATHGLMYTFREVNLVIHQTRVSETPQEWGVTLEELYQFGAKATEEAALALSLRGDAAALSHLTPGDAQCRWCRAKYRCPALIGMVHSEVFTDFQKLEDEKAVPVPLADRTLKLPPAERAALLSRGMKRVKLIEEWCLAVRAEVDKAMLAGEKIPGFKLVQGRKGPRSWLDVKGAAEWVRLALTGDRLKKAFTEPALLSPTQLEGVLGKDSEDWKTLDKMTTQSPGKPSVAPESDKRPTWSDAATVEDFATDLSNLM